MSISGTGLQIAGFTVGWYGIIVMLGAWAGAILAAWAARRAGHDGEHVWRGLPYVFLCGLIGARLWFILFPPMSIATNGRTASWFFAHFFDLNQGALALWTGGLGLFGGMLGGVLGLWRYTRVRRLSLLPWLDFGALGLCLALTIGRWGNGANQELYGPPTGLPWGILVNTEAQRAGPYTDITRFPLEITRFHPVFAYESILSGFILFFLLFLFLRRRSVFRDGDLTLIFLILYGAGRGLLEFLRVNVSLVGPVNISQAACGILVVCAVFLLLRSRRAFSRSTDLEKRAIL